MSYKIFLFRVLFDELKPVTLFMKEILFVHGIYLQFHYF
jgi:hypothetical protein